MSKLSSLLVSKRFAPYFFTQFLGAFNDNVFKYALTIVIAYQFAAGNPDLSNTLINLCTALLILPFFLFSALAGQWADKFEKAKMIRLLKLSELTIMALASVAFLTQNVWALMALLFCMGWQSAMFSPIKYSILPDQLKPEELVGGNGLVTGATFIAILMGTVTGGVLIAFEESGPIWVSLTLVGVAAAGYIASLSIPSVVRASPKHKVSLNPIKPLLVAWRDIRHQRAVVQCIVGIAWFAFMAATYVTQLPNLTKLYLGGNEHVVILLTAAFAFGIGIGSVLCHQLSKDKVEPALIPIGALLLTIFSIDFYFATRALVTEVDTLKTVSLFIADKHSIRLCFDIIIMGICGGLYAVPMYSLMQERTERAIRSRVIALSNIIDSAMVTIAAFLAIALLKAGLPIPELLLITAGLNALAAIYIFKQVPEFVMRFVTWLLIRTIYKVSTKGAEHLPREGAAMIVCNHVCKTDSMLITSQCRRPIRFVMAKHVYEQKGLNYMYKAARCIPIASKQDYPECFERGMQAVDDALANGELVAIFPEGKLTPDGTLQEFKPGVLRMIEKHSVPVVPMALDGLWESIFSRNPKTYVSNWYKRWGARVRIHIGEPMDSKHLTTDALQDAVQTLKDTAKSN